MKCHAGPIVRVNERLLLVPWKRHTVLQDIGDPSPDISIPSNAKAGKTLPSLAWEAVNLSRRLIRTIKASSVHYLFLLNSQMMSFQTEASGHNVTTWSVTNHRVPRLTARAVHPGRWLWMGRSVTPSWERQRYESMMMERGFETLQRLLTLRLLTSMEVHG